MFLPRLGARDRNLTPAPASGTAVFDGGVGTFSFASMAIGRARGDRWVVVVLTMIDDTTFATCTVNGFALTKAVEAVNAAATPDVVCAIFAGPVPSGESVTIAGTTTAAGGNKVVGMAAFTVYGARRVRATGTDTGADPRTLSLLLPTPYLSSAIYGYANSAFAAGTTWTNAQEYLDFDVNPAGGAPFEYQMSVAFRAPNPQYAYFNTNFAPGAQTVTADGDAGDAAMAGVVLE